MSMSIENKSSPLVSQFLTRRAPMPEMAPRSPRPTIDMIPDVVAINSIS